MLTSEATLAAAAAAAETVAVIFAGTSGTVLPYQSH